MIEAMQRSASAGSAMWRSAFFLGLLVVLVLSLLPGEMLPPVHSGWDKADHSLAYFGLGVLGWRAYPRNGAMVIAGLVAFGAVVELLQGLSGYRFAEWSDMLANGIGLLASLLVRAGANFYVRRVFGPTV